MAYWAAIRHHRKLGSDKKCENPPCQALIAAHHKYCWRCTIFGGQRKIP